MINQGATLGSRLAVSLAFLFTLAACGGGGGGGGSTFFDDGGSSGGGGVGTLALALALFNAEGQPTDTVNSAAPGTLTVSIPGGTANVLVTVETTVGTILPESKTALTNLLGVATFQIVAGLESSTGTITATATTGSGNLAGSLTFQVTASELALVLLDPQGNETNTVTSSSPGTLRATVGGSGANVVVSATTNVGVLFPASGTALTNSSGVATFQIEAGGEKGAGSVTATAATSAGSISASLPYQVGDSGLRLGYFDADDMFVENQILIEPESTLAAAGNAQLSVVVLNAEGDRVATAEDVRFSSGCIAAALATINPTIAQSVNGQASTLYSSLSCSGTDSITASLVGADAQAFGTINIAGATTNSVNFVSAEPLLVVLRGTGGQGRDETSNVVFDVVDGAGRPLPGVNVQFSLTTFIGGLSLSKTSALSNGDGQVSVTVQAGEIPSVVRVLATVDDGDGNVVTTVSDLLTVTTGLPDQNSISLSVGDCGDEGSFVVDGGMNIDGLCRELTVRMADKFNNPVVDGTAAVFTTEYGSIVGSCTTTAGACSVDWTSQAPRFPTLTGSTYVVTNSNTLNSVTCPGFPDPAIPCPTDLGSIRGGRSTILVTAIGEESFIDRNGNGVMDQSEQNLFENLPEAFHDENEDTFYTPALPACVTAPQGSIQCISGQEEIFVDFNANNTYDLNDDPAVYNGLLCPVAGDGVWCSRELINVRDSAIVTLGDETLWLFRAVPNDPVGNSQFVTVHVADSFNNPPPAGATVNLSTVDNCELVEATTFDIFNRSDSGAFTFFFTSISEVKNPPETGQVVITLNTPLTTTTLFYPCVN